LALERGAYGNPLDILIFRESKSCKGCKHHQNLTLLGHVYELCALGKPFGKRCKKYQEKDNDVHG